MELFLRLDLGFGGITAHFLLFVYTVVWTADLPSHGPAESSALALSYETRSHLVRQRQFRGIDEVMRSVRPPMTKLGGNKDTTDERSKLWPQSRRRESAKNDDGRMPLHWPQ